MTEPLEEQIPREFERLSHLVIPPQYQPIVDQYAPKIIAITSSNSEVTLTPDQIRNMYQLRDSLYTELRTHGYDKTIASLEELIETRKSADTDRIDKYLASIETFRIAIDQIVKSQKVPDINSPLTQSYVGQSRQSISILVTYIVTTQAYNDINLSVKLAQAHGTIDNYLKFLGPEINKLREKNFKTSCFAILGIGGIVLGGATIYYLIEHPLLAVLAGTALFFGAAAVGAWEVTTGSLSRKTTLDVPVISESTGARLSYSSQILELDKVGQSHSPNSGFYGSTTREKLKSLIEEANPGAPKAQIDAILAREMRNFEVYESGDEQRIRDYEQEGSGWLTKDPKIMEKQIELKKSMHEFRKSRMRNQ